MVSRHSLIHYEGPLPPAKEFADYKKGHKNAPERILCAMEKVLDQDIKDRDFAHDYLRTQGFAESRRKDKAQWFIFIVILVTIAAATATAIYTNKLWLPLLFGFIALVLLTDRYLERLSALFTKAEEKNKKKR